MTAKSLCAGAIGAAFAVGMPASAEIIELVDPLGNPSGWQAETFNGDVELTVEMVQDGTLFFQKAATFTEIDEFTGEPSPVVISFTQILPDDQTADQFVITQEMLTNMTGLDWVDFEFILVDGGDATWNQDGMADLDISPFTGDEFHQNSTIYRTFGGTVVDGATWTPGANGGEFVIDIDLSGDAPMVFSLKEAPSIPAPGAMALLAAGALGMTRRRRR